MICRSRTVAALVAAVALVGCATGGETDVSTTTIANDATTTTVAGPVKVSVTVGTDSATDRVEEVPLGSSVEVTLLNSTASDEYHLHGYDVETGEVDAGVSATISFTADKAGDFELESHVTGDVLVVIRVG